jgi:hypothetical protein
MPQVGSRSDMGHRSRKTDLMFCLFRASGFDSSAVEPDNSAFNKRTSTHQISRIDNRADTDGSVFAIAAKKLGTSSDDKRYKIDNASAKLANSTSNLGYRIIMDEDKTSILIGGKGG